MKLIVLLALFGLTISSSFAASCREQASDVAEEAIRLLALNDSNCSAVGRIKSLQKLPSLSFVRQYTYEATFASSCRRSAPDSKVNMVLDRNCRLVHLNLARQ